MWLIAYPKPVLAATGLDVYIYATIGSSSSSSSAFLSSHSWIVIKNNGSAVKIGDYNLGQGKSITLGAWGNGQKPWCIWYGRDAVNRTKFPNNSNTVYMKKNVISSKATTITNIMKNYGLYNPTTK